MKAVVVYRSKSGFVKKYAEWIAEELNADLFEHSKITADELMVYDTIIYGGGLYVVGINGVKLIKDNLSKLSEKKILVFASGATPGRVTEIEKIRNGNFSADEQERIKFFYLRGGFDYGKLTFTDKLMMRALKFKLSHKKVLSPDEKGMLATYSTPVDFTQRQYIQDIVEYVRS